MPSPGPEALKTFRNFGGQDLATASTPKVCETISQQLLKRRCYLDSQVAGNNRPLYPRVDHYWFKVAPNYEPQALQVGALELPDKPIPASTSNLARNPRGLWLHGGPSASLKTT